YRLLEYPGGRGSGDGGHRGPARSVVAGRGGALRVPRPPSERRPVTRARAARPWLPTLHRLRRPASRQRAPRGLALAPHPGAAPAPPPLFHRLLVASPWPLTRVGPPSAPVAEAGRWLLAQVAGPYAITLGAMHVPNRVTGRKFPFPDAVLGMAHTWRRGPALLVGDTNSGLIDLDEEVPAFNAQEDGWLRGLEAAAWRAR